MCRRFSTFQALLSKVMPAKFWSNQATPKVLILRRSCRWPGIDKDFTQTARLDIPCARFHTFDTCQKDSDPVPKL